MPIDTVTVSIETSSVHCHQYPKPENCRAKNIVAGRIVQCMTPGMLPCYYAMPFGKARLCINPERMEIAARTEAEEKKKEQ
jgi:hypothetical protein